MLISVDPSAPVAIAVLNPVVPSSMFPVLFSVRVPLTADLGGASLAPGAPLVPGLVLGRHGKAPGPKDGRTPPTTRMSGAGSPSFCFKAPHLVLVLDFRHPVHHLTLPVVRSSWPAHI